MCYEDTVESADLLVHPDALRAERAGEKLGAIFDYWDMVNRQDIAAVERVQRGIQARGYPGGRMCFRFEEPIHRFQNMVIDRMVGQHRIPAGDSQKGPCAHVRCSNGSDTFYTLSWADCPCAATTLPR